VRIIFTGRDMGRVRLKCRWDPLTETVRSVRMLRRSEQPWLNPWRASTRSRLDSRMGPLLELVPADGWIPDFLLPAHHAQQLTAALEQVRSTPDESIYPDLAQIAAERPLPPTARALANGQPRTLGELADAIAAYHHLAVAPHADAIAASIDAERALRARMIADGGLDLMLATLHPAIRWIPPCLEIMNFKPRAEVHLAGQGLLIAPHVFVRQPCLDPAPVSQAPILNYPIPDELRVRAMGSSHSHRGGHLAALLGPTRARALDALDAGCTTTELARQLGITPATASEHTAILRNTGLIITRRHRNTVLHTLTPLGHALLALQSTMNHS
jgi:Helix-turn-helix domain